MKIAIDYSDALIVGSEEIPKDLTTYMENSNKPVLEYKKREDYGDAYNKFLLNVLG